MQYVMLIYETPRAFADRERDPDDAYFGAWRAYYKTLAEAGVYVAGEPLHAAETGTTIRQRDGKRQIQDGPYANTKEQLGGFIILELPSLDAALEWASRCPTTATGAVEVRPLASDFKLSITGGDK